MFEVDTVARILKKKYGKVVHYNKKNPLDELIFIICSIKRSERVYLESFRVLKRKYPSYKKMSEASLNELRTVLAPYGLQNYKAYTIKEILNTLVKYFGRPTLNPLRRLSDEDCEQFLVALKGVGKKVARCVMMYSLGRQAFPVDSNCWRVSYRLGWIDWVNRIKSISPKDMDRLQSKIPAKLRYSLHVNMVYHGRTICTAKNPKCHLCIVSRSCQKK